MSDATSMAEDFASGRSDPVQILEQALEKASEVPAVFISLTAERARRDPHAPAARRRARPPRTVGGRRRRTATPHAQAHCAGARRLPARHARADARDARARRDQNPPATPHGRVRRRVAA